MNGRARAKALAGAFQKELSANLARKNSSNRVVFASFRAWDHRAQTQECLIGNHGTVILLYGSVGLASACRS